MRRIAFICLIPLVVAAFVAVSAPASDDGEYLVRAYFDNGSFVVTDEDVRIAGANVGSVEAVEASLEGERVSYEEGREEQPGTAVIVMRIDDPGYQEFLRDAYCLIRPQSLLGERYIDCRPTEPRAPGDEPPPPLEKVPEGERGEGQHFLPVENTGKTVDTDLLNNVMRLPYRERLRLILNDLGAAFASRGEDVARIVENANPTLRDGNRVLGELASQNRRLARLSSDSQRILRPLARERHRVRGFLANAGTAAESTAARRAELEQAMAKFPGFLRELRSTMAEFEEFSQAALPVAADLGIAAPSLTAGTEALTPFAEASEEAVVTLGEAAEDAGPDFVEAETVVTEARDLAVSGVRPTRELKRFLGSVRDSRGFERLMDLIYYTALSMNGFDEYGHFMRTLVMPIDCFVYEHTETATNCWANFRPPDIFGRKARRGKKDRNRPRTILGSLLDVLGDLGSGATPGNPVPPTDPGTPPDPEDPEDPEEPEEPADPEDPEEPTAPEEASGAGESSAAARELRAADQVMRFMLEP